MKIEKLTDNKIKIILNLEDLKEKNIDFHSFMSNSIETQDLFIDILKEAEKQVGFVTNNYNIHIEAFATSDGDFIFTITRISVIEIPKRKKLIYKRKKFEPNRNVSIYCFHSFDDYCNFCSFLNSNSSNYLGNSSLIQYKSKYYLILTDIKMNLVNSKQFFTYISEFANICNKSGLFTNILLEHGEKLIDENAIEIGLHYFGQKKVSD
ncbi:MAG: adaptor protein MecA [Clostridia bacterium]|nr:adaptor protein MecA [Clostridia bacterium]